MKQQRISVSPGPDLPGEEAASEVVKALMSFFADQLERDGKLEQARAFRAKIADQPGRARRNTEGR